MKVAIMQPYFLPYIGYFQLIQNVDLFVVYDNIQYSKKGWINRNRILAEGKDHMFTLPLKKDSDFLNINQRFLSENFDKEKSKLINKIKGAYRKAPYFNETLLLFENIINYGENNLFDYVYQSLIKIKDYLSIDSKMMTSSTLDFNIEEYKAEDKVLAICKNLGATTYINPIGGLELYDKARFSEHGIDLRFLKSTEVVYKQFDNEFIPWLSIIDVLMFNNKETVKMWLRENFKYETN